MVFGLFKRPADTTDLYVHYIRLQTECPGAAYMFANSFKIAFGYAQVPGVSKSERKDYVEAYHEEGIKTFQIDKGTRMLAVECIRHIADRAPGGWDRFPTDGHIVAICKGAAYHRDLEDEDHLPPPPGIRLDFLKHVGVDNLADYVAQAEARTPDEADKEEREWERGKSIAIYDMFEEHASGRLMELLGYISTWSKT